MIVLVALLGMAAVIVPRVILHASFPQTVACAVFTVISWTLSMLVNRPKNSGGME